MRDQQAPVVIQDANDLLYNEPSHIQFLVLSLNRGSEALSQNSASMFSDSDIAQTYKKKQGKGLTLALDQTIQKRKPPPHFTTLNHKISSLFRSKGHIFHVYLKHLNKEPQNKIIIKQKKIYLENLFQHLRTLRKRPKSYVTLPLSARS